jgi:MFS family permease
MLATGLLYLWSFRLSSVAVVVSYLLILGLVSNFVPTAAFTLTPETVPNPALVGPALAALNVGANLGVLLGPPLLGAIAGGGQWSRGTAALIAVSGVGVAAALLLWKKERQA